jgi:gamma-tubulin complex component 3
VDAQQPQPIARTTFYTDAAPLIGGRAAGESLGRSSSMQVPLFSVASPVKKSSAGGGGSVTPAAGGVGRSTLELGRPTQNPRESAASRPTQNYTVPDERDNADRPSSAVRGSVAFGADPQVRSNSSSGGVLADNAPPPPAASFPQPSVPSSRTAVTGGRAAGPSLPSAPGAHSSKPLDDASFLQDILYCWMGADQTQYFAYNAPQRRYQMREGSARQQATFESLQGCGAAAKMIDETLRKQVFEPSFLQQSLRSAVRKQLTQYHYFVSSFREKGPSILLGELVQASKKIHPKLVTLLTILQETERAKGGELVSKLQGFLQQGSQRLAQLVQDIYLEAIGPLLIMTVQFILRGEAPDPFHEFYITSNPKVEDTSDAFWTEKFSIIPEMIPTTVPKAVAEKVLLVAKNVAFIKKCCRAKDWRMDAAIANDAQNCTFENLYKVVHQALVCSNSAVMKLLTEKLKLQAVLSVVNAFLLVGNGDFYEMLIRRLDALLLRPSTMVQTASVREHMQSALLEISPHAKGLDADLLHSVHCELIKDDKIIGWDAFVVTMPIPSPLNNIFDATAMKVYKRLFRMMFKVKRSEVCLKLAWRQSVVLDRVLVRLRRDDPNTRALREVAGDAHLLGMELTHFVTNLWSYIVCEVCTAARDKLTKALQSCSSLDETRAAHNQYLQQLTLYSLLHADCANTKQNVDAILAMTREYCTVQSLLTNLLERHQGDLGRIRTEYQRIQDAFHQEMSILLTTLEEQHLQFDFMNFLFLRLNFNQFYRDTSIQGTNTEF